MGRLKRKLEIKRRVASINELAEYFGVHRHTIKKWLKEEQANLHNTFSVFDFVIKSSKRKKH